MKGADPIFSTDKVMKEKYRYLQQFYNRVWLTRLTVMPYLFVVKLFMCQSSLGRFGRPTSELDVFSTTVFSCNKLIALKRMKFIVYSQTKKTCSNRRKYCTVVSLHFSNTSFSHIFSLSSCSIRSANLCFPSMMWLYKPIFHWLKYHTSPLSCLLISVFIELTLNLCTMLGLVFELWKLGIIVFLM